MIMGIVSPVIALAVFVGIIALFISMVRRRGTGAGGVDTRSVRRFFQYLLLAILFVVVTIGLADLVALALGAGPSYGDPSDNLARALAFVIVGTPLAIALAWWTLRAHRVDATEGESPVFVVYMTLMLFSSLVTAAAGLQDVLAGVIGRSRLEADSVGLFVAWGALWVLHWLAAKRLLTADRNLPQLLLGSLVGLVMGTYGLTSTLGTSIKLLTDSATYVNPSSALGQGLSLLIVGALVWVWYWARGTIGQPRQILWHAYVLLAGVAGGFILALVGASQMLWSVLVWFLGDRFGVPAYQHFEHTAIQFAAVLVGLLIWWYHRTVLGESAEGRNEVKRVYEYLIAGVALSATATGVGTVLVAFIEALTAGADLGMTTKNTVLAAVTMLIVGAPVWWVYWRRIRAAVAADPVGEVPSISRRIFLVALFGIAGIAAVVALLTAGYMFFQDIVGGNLGVATIRTMRYALGVMVASAAVSVYHGVIFVQDRKVALPERVAGPASVVLVGAADEGLAKAVNLATGARVEVWERLDTASPAWDQEAVLSALGGHAGRDVLIVADGPQLRVLEVGLKHR